MSVYSELLKMAVAQNGTGESSVGELVSQALSARPTSTDGAPTADRVADWLAYDMILVHLCDRLGIEHRMLDPDSGPASRTRAEDLVAEKVPFFSKALNTA